MLLANIG